jgi:SH3 domain
MPRPPAREALPLVPSAPVGVDQAEVLYDSAADIPAELAVSAGDIVSVLSRDGQWCECELQSTGATGFIPTSYLHFYS